jgi:hypothetical protein
MFDLDCGGDLPQSIDFFGVISRRFSVKRADHLVCAKFLAVCIYFFLDFFLTRSDFGRQ